jgi:DNA-binding transcriptional ArsR family regulator
MANTNALAVCADPTRQAVLTALRHGPRSVGEIAQGLPVSQSAVSQHLRVLREAGLVRSEAAGTRRLYSVDLDGLGELRAWFDRFWDDALDAFAHHVESSRSGGQTTSTPKETP